MNLLIVGINHNSAPVELREKVAFTPEQLGDALHNLSDHAGFSEVAILSTCNRTEIIAVSRDASTARVIDWLATYHQLTPADLAPSIYEYANREAVRHAMRVASGLDSMVVGETQIFGQFKDCIDIARTMGTLGSELDQLSQSTFRVAKKVRTDTAVGENSVSVASTAVTLAGQLFSNLANCRVLLIGAGDTSELVGKHLLSAGIREITVANRTLENARRLAAELDGHAIDLQSIPAALPDADVVIASTAAQLPILGKGTVERALKSRKHKPILMVDLAVPRDIEPEVGDLRDIYLYSVDDLQEIISVNLSSRADAAREAESIVDEAATQFRTRAESRGTGDMVSRFRRMHNALRDQELEKALSRLEKGDDPRSVLTQLANQLTNKIIHTPSVELKNAATSEDADALETIARLYGLNQFEQDDREDP